MAHLKACPADVTYYACSQSSMVPVRSTFAHRQRHQKSRLSSRKHKNGRGAHAPRPPCQRRPTRQHYRPRITSPTSLPPPITDELDKFVPTHPEINAVHIQRRGSRDQRAVQRLDDEHTSVTAGNADTALGLSTIQHGRKPPPSFGECEYFHGQPPVTVTPSDQWRADLSTITSPSASQTPPPSRYSPATAASPTSAWYRTARPLPHRRACRQTGSSSSHQTRATPSAPGSAR
jgi:hypothetical protein